MSDLIDRQAAIVGVSFAMSDSPSITREDWDAVIEMLEGIPSANQWIPVTERLPEDGKWALFTDGKSISTERYKQDALDHFWPTGRFFNLEEATAWMPLPEPWREDDNE